MNDFIRSAYSFFGLIGFWVILIGCTIGGCIVGTLGGSGFALLGLIIGGLIGFITAVNVSGFTSTIINIAENIERQNYLLSKLTGDASSGNTSPTVPSGNASSAISSGNVSPLGAIQRNDNAEAKKKCNNCGIIVPVDKYKCPKCQNANNFTYL